MGFINQLITGGAPHCRLYAYAVQLTSHPKNHLPIQLFCARYKGDFRSELCSDGEAMRIDPEGKPYLVP